MFARVLSTSGLGWASGISRARKPYSRLALANLGNKCGDYTCFLAKTRAQIRLNRGFSSENSPAQEIHRRVQEASSALPIDRQHQELIQSRLEELEANKPDLDKFALFNPETLAELPFFLDFLEPVVSQGKVKLHM